jgi:hypothetical protein
MAEASGDQAADESQQPQESIAQEATSVASAGSQVSSVKAGRVAHGADESQSQNVPLKIATIGDIFIERFLWSDSESTTLGGQLPYTAPDDLRTHDFTSTFVELSGSPLHSEIYRKLLSQCGFEDETHFKIEPVPSPDEIAELANDLLGKGGGDRSFRDFFAKSFSLDASFGPFPIYLHELSAYSAEDASTNKKKRVWRIKNSHGEVRAPKPNKEIIERVQSAITTLHKKIGDWLQNRRKQPGPTVVVVCDRNADKNTMHGRAEAGASARSAFGQIMEALKTNSGNEIELIGRSEQDVLLIWHTRSPLFPSDNKSGALSRFFLEDHVARRTIPIISDRCLREEGVKLRFDVSYESSLKDLIAARKHPVIKKLMQFPHALIRFDYGIVHVTNSGGEAVGLDLHAFASGNYLSPATKQGVVQGMTPLLVGAILREVVKSCEDHGKAAGGVKSFLDKINGSLHPTVLHNTPLDRAIDAALILWNLHYKRGYTDATGDICFGNVENAFRSEMLFESLVKRVVEAVPTLRKNHHATAKACRKTLTEVQQLAQSDPNGSIDLGDERQALAAMDQYLTEQNAPQSAGTDWLDAYLIVEEGSRLERLSRLSRPLDGKPFSRAQLLRKRGVMVGAAGVPTLGAAGKNVAAKEKMRQRVLLRIVERGLEYVLQRPDLKAEVDGKNVVYRLEPSVVVPNLQFGSMATIDPQDINSFLALRNLVDKYLAADGWKNPLAIAVFGKPGSGKSTIVKKILADVPNCELDPGLECNLSQWTSLDRLSLHFQKIQDRTLHTRKTQIVFFDEFDSPLENEPVGWLKYFLMPLQDGMYMVGNDTFHFGKSIFVFAGGIAHTYDDFVKKSLQHANAKVPDFVSRLRGHIDVKDISLSTRFVPARKTSAADHAAQIRRAILLRELLLRHMKGIFDRSESIADVSPEVVYAFLNIPSFTHGVRSMEAIVQMSLVSGHVASFKPSSLPTEQQLQLHVNQAEFMKLVRTCPFGKPA